MFNNQKLFSGKIKYLIIIAVLTLISVGCLAFNSMGGNDFDSGRREVLLRRVGHELLLQSGDSTSRVLPVVKIAENKYQIRFEDDFTFMPDSLVKTTRRLLDKSPFENDYIVNVLNCADSSVAYGYAISKNEKDDIVACLGREQPRACYMINITFKQAGITYTEAGYLLGSLPLLAFAGFIVFRYRKPKKAVPAAGPAGIYTLGSVVFDAKNRKLDIDGHSTDLTATETRVLLIFAQAPNQAVERSRLQKEIWEDEGVIVGRSLDVFISKLRKKLEVDPNIKIAVIRGKGYKLEISA
ncbi:winged helix-turn-helix domain-containing protein [Flavobacterium sp. RHBU_24]|uniref:winged helix-turn-helix domain-containing protein n=1 Tax=Flavobacterium sp. RHBU_24 TaxID=3391185 RepID=UPI003984F048